MKSKSLKEFYVFLQALKNGIDYLDISTALSYAAESVSSGKFREKARRIAQKVSLGHPLYKALQDEGFPKILVSQFMAYENAGVIKEGIESILNQIEKFMEIETSLRKIDRDMYIIAGLFFVAIGVLVGFYLPTVAEKLLSQLGDETQLKRDWFIWFIYSNFADMSLWKKALWIGLAGFVLYLVFFQFKLYRYLMNLIPAYRKLGLENDKALILTLFINTSNVETAMNIIKDVFKQKYNMHIVYRLFPEKNFKAFYRSNLFNLQEKKMFANISETGNTNLFRFLLLEVERRRKQYVETVSSIMNLVKLGVGAGIVISIYGITLFIVFKLQGFISAASGG
ncbi:MAG: type II secretion system F family protein [Nanopusillaceae archaeon]